jgi:hypothetical protein
VGAAAAVIAAIGGVGLVYEVEAGMWTRFGVGAEWSFVPAQSTDFMAAHDIRGRGFNSFETGGWLLHRFWPDSTRLPFIDIHQTGRPEDLAAYAAMYDTPAAWRTLDDRYHFPWVLLWSAAQENALDQDSSFVPVFMEDAAVLYLRRDGPYAEVARRYGYRVLPGGNVLKQAIRNGSQPHQDERLGAWSLALGDPAAATTHLQRAWIVDGASPQVALLLGSAWHARGDIGKARRWFRKAIELDPNASAASDSLSTLEGGR